MGGDRAIQTSFHSSAFMRERRAALFFLSSCNLVDQGNLQRGIASSNQE